MAQTNNYQDSVAQRIQQEKLAVQFIKNINDLYLDKGIETVLFRNTLVDQRPSEVLNLHSYARNFVGQNITISDTVSLLDELVKLDLAPARMDIGRLASEWLKEGNIKQIRYYKPNKENNYLCPVKFL